MKISTKVRYGVKALVYIAEASQKGNLARIKEISESEDISVQYLEQILFKLKNENIIQGKRGPNGGYKLSMEPEDITLHELYKILDEEVKVIDCNENNKSKNCSCIDDECSTSCIWSKLDIAMTKILEGTTLAELIKNKDMI
ncbi:MAG: RrF2 family transcriptional regulator [Cetobacterium sp.]|uniref:RrF2 family transcriptional regulator n=1 Tax=unclassified Cetobacterium TaxID=2630983 RepID=UPI0006480165|nr:MULTISPECIES: Rrf2 family transcriptional regulator [unclassified Cetobacterium]